MARQLHLISVSAAALLTAVAAYAPASAQSQPRQKIDVSKLGPQVGDRVPDFDLKDQNGKNFNLKSIMGPKGAMLVFLRSADW
jgi:cytochrome oxidase Cu insertion factor (SCO1/SenC/PrrC family)